jgi:hypothetical protein
MTAYKVLQMPAKPPPTTGKTHINRTLILPSSLLLATVAFRIVISPYASEEMGTATRTDVQ